MSNIDDEKTILNEAPDFDNQLQILEEEHKNNVKRRKKYILLVSMFLFVVFIFYVSYATIYVYREYGPHYCADCDNVNIKVDGSPVPNINISDGKDCIPEYNIDYYNNRKAYFNLDLFGDRTQIFNAMNQMDETGTYCVLNCDRNADGWPDYNIDLNGDGIADLNIVNDPRNNRGKVCDLNCDSNHDTIPDYNIDTNGDGKADVNIKNPDDGTLNNVDYKGNREPVFNIINDDGTITNPVTDVKNNPNCTVNCDKDGDGRPDYNIKLHEDDDLILNELIDGEYVNIDVDGDGIPDVNITDDGKKPYENPINNPVTIDGKDVVLNEDVDGDGLPDNNIDLDGDGKPDLNITDKNGKCIKNCDTNGDGKADDLIGIGDNIIPFRDINIDYDYDGVCDVNCDLDYDLYPDINIDTNGDIVPDINIDYDHDGKPDYNIDTDGDGYPDLNIDAYGLGECNFNCQGPDGKITNPVGDNSSKCKKNCDTNGDGLPDTNVDLDNDGRCDINCDNGKTKKDTNNNYILDDDENMAHVDVSSSPDYDFSIINNLDIIADGIEPDWDSYYVMTIKNDTYYAVAYDLQWENVINTFSVYNLDYYVTRSNTMYIDYQKAPYHDEMVKHEVLIRPKTTIKYALFVEWKETGTNQNVDSGKQFKAIFRVKVIE